MHGGRNESARDDERYALVVDARALWGSGIGRHTREITSRLMARGAFSEVVVAGDVAELQQWSETLGSPGTLRILPIGGGRYSLRSQVGWTRAASRLPRPGVAWFPHWDAPALFRGPPSVVTVHDLIHVRVPGSASVPKRAVMRRLLRTATHRATRVVTVSEYSRRDLIAFDPSLSDRVTVVPSGVPAAFLASSTDAHALPSGVRPPFLLCVANRKPHKNLVIAVEVLARLRSRDPSLTLVVAGERFPEWRAVMARAETLGVAGAVVDLAPVDDEVLAALYHRCECLLFPSLYEGFGLPVLEAMACGAPVVASNATSIPEVAGGAALLADPLDAAMMASHVERLRSDRALRVSQIDRGRVHARRFTWDRAAEAMERVLLDAAG